MRDTTNASAGSSSGIAAPRCRVWSTRARLIPGSQTDLQARETRRGGRARAETQPDLVLAAHRAPAIEREIGRAGARGLRHVARPHEDAVEVDLEDGQTAIGQQLPQTLLRVDEQA